MDEINNEAQSPSLRERNRQRLIRRIVESAAELFSSLGYEHTTMDAIAERAQVSRATLFNYFSTKRALLMPFAYEIYKKEVQPEFFLYLEALPTTQEALRALFMSIYKHILTYPNIEDALQEEFALLTEARRQLYHDKNGFLETLVTVLQYGQQRQEVRTDIPLFSLARYVGTLYLSLIHQVMSPSTPTHYDEEVEQLLRFLAPALSPYAE